MTVESLAGTLRVATSNESAELRDWYSEVRRWTEQICRPLSTEDYVIQSMPDASPVKWHLAHTSWFFETFILVPHVPGYKPFHPEFGVLFNSYYNAVGPRWPRPQRGLLSRPTVGEIYAYRAHVDQGMAQLFEPGQKNLLDRVAGTLALGLNHEQQHQELILTDLKHALACNPLHPCYRESKHESRGSNDAIQPPASSILDSRSSIRSTDWLAFPAGVYAIGHEGNGFAFDNESPRHKVYLNGFQMATELVINGEYLAFIEDGGYERPELWLSDGWAARQAQNWTAPLYWDCTQDQWQVMTLSGLKALDPREPVCHVSFYEGDAYARWIGARLPLEGEWEVAATAPIAGHFLESERFHPGAHPAPEDRGPLFRLYGDVWQWTASPYVGYPGYAPLAGALGEYNGKFMCNQLVLRGASCVTPRSHARRTYRNFFPPDARWQFMGIRLAK
jgi:ergothioneine biosynthesis protein EgtB